LRRHDRLAQVGPHHYKAPKVPPAEVSSALLNSIFALKAQLSLSAMLAHQTIRSAFG